MCTGREPDREMQGDEELALDEIRQLFARYRRIARHANVIEHDDMPQPSVEETEKAPVLTAR
jgi:hypothetical protein